MSSKCPNPIDMIQLGTSAVGDATNEIYSSHVENCTHCRAVLQRFVDSGMKTVGTRSKVLPHCDEFPTVSGFTIERELGRGGMGVVYLATQDHIGRRVALKVVPGGPAAGGRERRRWLREAEAASKLRSPHVVNLYDFGEADLWYYLVLEFIPGGTLKNRLTGPIPPRDAARLVETVARAVQQIHCSGLYHLDLKPSNILLDGDEDASWASVVPKVSDFGIARLAADEGTTGSRINTGQFAGTPAYMSPEQVRPSEGPVGPATDVYALGTILYELLTGRPPFQANSIAETLEQVCKEDPVPPHRLNRSIPRDLEVICLKCLEKPAARRYESAEALSEDIGRFLNHCPIHARPVSFIEHGWAAGAPGTRRCRRWSPCLC